MNEIKLNLKKDKYIISILGEVCLGLEVQNFEEKLGVSRQIAESFLHRLIDEEKTGNENLFITDTERYLLLNALEEVKRQIEEWEFQTRIGVTVDEAVTRLSEVLQK